MRDYIWRRELLYGFVLAIAISLANLNPLIQRGPPLIEIGFPLVPLHFPT